MIGLLLELGKRMRNKATALAIISAALSLLAASYLNISQPITATLNQNGSVYLGKVGPGESFYILANSTAPNGKQIVNVGWDKLETSSLPSGWSSQPSQLYANPMKLKVTVSPTSANGTYKIGVRAVNVGNYSGLGNLTFYAYVNVTPSIYSVSVSPRSLSSGLGQPTNIYVTINNTGISDDLFILSSSGLPAWNLTERFASIHLSKDTFAYPIFADEPGTYQLNFSVDSATSSSIRQNFPIRFTIAESIGNDYAAVGKGMALSPVIFEPAYALMSLISWASGALAH